MAATNTGMGTNYIVKGVLALVGMVAIGGVYVFSGGVKIADSAADHTITISTASNEAANRTLTIPALGANDTINTLGTAQTVTGAKTFSGDQTFTGGANAVTVGTPTTADATADTILASSATTQTPLVIQGIAAQSVNLTEWQNSTGFVGSYVSADALSIATYSVRTRNDRVNVGEDIGYGGASSGLIIEQDSTIKWSSTVGASGTTDIGFKRDAAGIVKVTNGSTGFGSLLTGGLNLDRTIEATTGNKTINKPAGRVGIAAVGTTVTVTNSLCTASSIVLGTISSNGTASLVKIVPAAGSFVITIVADAGNDTYINWLVTN